MWVKRGGGRLLMSEDRFSRLSERRLVDLLNNGGLDSLEKDRVATILLNRPFLYRATLQVVATLCSPECQACAREALEASLWP